MDNPTKQGSMAGSTASNLSSTAGQVKDKVSEEANAARDKLTEVGKKAAEKVETATEYFRNTDISGMIEDVHGIVKRYPGAALGAAAFVGFLLAHAFHRD